MPFTANHDVPESSDASIANVAPDPVKPETTKEVVEAPLSSATVTAAFRVPDEIVDEALSSGLTEMVLCDPSTRMPLELIKPVWACSNGQRTKSSSNLFIDLDPPKITQIPHAIAALDAMCRPMLD